MQITWKCNSSESFVFYLERTWNEEYTESKLNEMSFTLTKRTYGDIFGDERSGPEYV